MTPDEVRTGVSRLSVVERMAVEEAARLIKSGYLETAEGKAKMQEAILALARAGSE